ncbi:MAG: putative hydro-lyase [Pirellulales bacterium]
MTPHFLNPADLRGAIRRGEFSGQTSGQCPGFVQTNLVVVPQGWAEEFADFCRKNPKPCPLVEQLSAGEFRPSSATDADLRTDVPRYRVFRNGVADATEPSDLQTLWRDDFVSFLIGCSFTFEAALLAAGLPVRHLDERRNVPMYRTSQACVSVGRFSGPLVVSMRPYRREHITTVIDVTSRFPAMHGSPVHIGDPATVGIGPIHKPDFGDAVTIHDDEVPVFWACGVTPQLALAAARPEIAVTHSPGCMFVTDLPDRQFETP